MTTAPTTKILTKHGLVILLLLILSGIFGIWFAYRSDAGAGEIRNVLLISIDTCRADYLSCYGYELPTTPNIDAMAAEGILFENVIAPIPETLPSHSSMLTGTIPPYHGVHANIGGYLADESNITLPEILKDAGFATGAVVSAFAMDSQLGISQGFDDYHDLFEKPAQGVRRPQREGGKTTDVALDWLEKNKDKRFFFFLHYFDPHAEYEPPEPFASRFAPNLYAGEIAYTDHCIGRVLGRLKELGLYDSTLIIITADHGEMLGEHGESTHSYLIYQGAIRVPLIFKLPGQNKAVRIKSIAGLIDIVPSVCRLLGIETPKNVQGINLFASSTGANTSEQARHIYCESLMPTKYKANSLLAVVNNRYKYIQTTRPELYDLVEDPGEANNLVEEQPKRVRIMQDKLAQMLEQSVRKASPDSKANMAPEASAQLEALGYVGGTVTEDFSFDQAKDDPKDLLEYHVINSHCRANTTAEKHDKVKILAEQMIQLQPNLPFGYEQLGSAALIQNDYSKAIVYFQKAIELAPDSPDSEDAYYKQGLAHEGKGEPDRAIDDYSNAIKLNPRLVEAYNNRGIIYSSKGELDRAIGDYNQAIKLRPQFADGYNNRGNAYFSKGDYERAIDDFGKAIELDPAFTHIYSYRGNVYLAKGDYDQAIRDYNKTIELDPENAGGYYNRARAYQGKGDYERAIDDYNKTIKLNPRSFQAYHNRGRIYSDKGEYKHAIRDFSKVVELNPRHAQAHNHLAWILATHKDSQVRNGARAVELAQIACELTDYKVATTLDTLAAAYAQLGQFDKAVETAAQAVQLARATKNEKLAKDIQRNLELYKAKRPYRESPSPQ